MIKIGDFAKICNVSTQTLRYYDSEGVLKADVTDSSSGYRYYSIDAIEKYKQILFYKNLGFSLDEIKKIQLSKNDQLHEILQNKKQVIFDTIEKLKKQINTIDDICKNSPKKDFLSEILLLPFENDPEIVGKWSLCGKLLDENDLALIDGSIPDSADREIIFMPGGALAWKYFWTKGTLYRISPKYRFAIPNSYKLLRHNDVIYMIIYYMSDGCIDDGEDTMMLLYRQVDNIAYTEYQIRPNVDKTDIPFVPDESVIGEWRAVDFVPEIADFNPNIGYSKIEDIYMVDLRFLSRGICTRTTRSMSGSSNYMLRYTKGYVLNDKEMTAEKYEIKVINKKEFLFVQHKSGDYYYGGMTPHWYVYERKEQ